MHEYTVVIQYDKTDAIYVAKTYFGKTSIEKEGCQMLTLKEQLEDIACNENITVINTPLPHTKSASSKDFRIIAVDREQEKSGDEETADLAHEIGHFLPVLSIMLRLLCACGENAKRKRRLGPYNISARLLS